MKKVFFLILCSLGLFQAQLHAQSPICGAATEFCAENNISFPAATGGSNPPAGNNYGCLSTQPNPAWYYMSTTAAGSAIINLTSAPSLDIDFALWGPFTSLADALGNCGSLGNPVDCSYDPSPNETVSLSSGGPGEFFILLITNFSNQPTDITGTTTSTILSCNACLAEGGSLMPGNQVGCFSTLDDIEVDFGAFTPSVTEYGYTMVVRDPITGTITQEFIGTTLSPTLLGPGTFSVCGISYEYASAPSSFVGQNYNSIQTDLASAMPSFCGDLSDNCVDITIRPDPIPSFVVDSVCLGASAPNCPLINNTYICNPGAGSFTVQTPFGCDSTVSYLITPRGSIVEVDSVQVCPGEPYTYNGVDYFAPGPAVINIPTSSTGCDTTLYLFVQEEPLFAFITPPIFNLDCLNPDVLLNSAGSSSGPNISQTWTGPTGVLGTGPTITVSDPGTYTLTVVRVDPRTLEECTVTATALITESPAETGQPVANGPASLCIGEDGVYSYSYTGPNGPYTFSYDIRNVPATVVSDIPGSLTLNFTSSGTAEVCFTATGGCGPTPETCVTTLIQAPVAADAGPDASFCALNGNVTGNPAGGIWSALTGPSGAGLVTSPNQPSTNVSAGSPGTYAFEYAFNGNCPSADTVLITFADPLAIINTDETCNNATLEYTVTFEITGGTPPYSTTGTPGTLAGNLFFSDPIASGDSYSIVVLDANACPATVQGSFNCACTTEAGDMPSTLIEVCVPDSIQSGVVSNEVNDGDDVGTYVLHTSPTDVLGTVLQTNPTRWFYFQAPVAVDVTYYVSYIIGTDDGNGNPDPNDPCFDVSVGQPVIWRTSPPIDAGSNQTVCGLSADLDATGTPGLWTVPAGTSVSSVADPRATFTASSAGTYILTWSSDGALCPASDQVEITVTEPINTVNVQETCDNITQEYVLTFEITGGTPPYITTGTPGTVAGNIFTSDPIASGDSYSLVVLDANGCPATVQGSTTCNCATDAGDMPNTLLEACIPADIQAGLVSNETLDGDDVGTYVLHTSSSGALGTVFQTNSTSLFSFQAPLVVDVIYYVSFIVGTDDGNGNPDPNDPCFDVSIGQPIVWRDIPVLEAGPDEALCGLSTTLQATGGPGLWTVPAGTSVSSTSDPNATFSSTTYGTFLLTWSSDGAFCPTDDAVEITFNEDPQATNSFDCDSGDPLATVTITASGGQAPYTLVGLPPSGPGPVFTLSLPAGVPYSFSIVDANGCSSVTYTNTPNCDCQTEAPTLTTGASLCAGEQVQLPAATGGVDDGNDVTTYILYEGSATSITNVLATSSSPSFPWDVSYLSGTTYYIAAVRGNDDGSGGVDPSDPCIDISLGVAVIWNALPTIMLDDAITCEGDTARVTFQYSGSLPAEIDLILGGIMRTVNISATAGEFTFFGEQGVVSVSSLRENPGCENTGVTNTANVSIQTIQSPVLEPDFSLCNSNLTSDPFERDLSTMVVSGGGGTWTSPDAPGALTGTNFSGLGLAPGRYLLVYETAAVASCPSQRADLFVTIRDCSCPNLTLIGPGVLCNNNARIQLDGLLEEAQVGNWSLTATPAGTQPALLTGGFFDATSADAGTYRLLFTLTQGNVAGCPDTASLAITVARQPLAGSSTGDLTFCEGDTDVVSLASLLTGQDAGGDWVNLSGGAAPLNGSVDISMLAAGDYTYEYTVTAPSPCNFARAEIQISVIEAPQVDAGADVTLTCTERIADLGSSPTPGINYSWSDASNGNQLGSSSTYQTDLSGLYELTATNNAGCSATDLVEVVVSNDVPEVYVSLQPISCANEMDASARIDSIAGGQGPYTVSFNGTRTNERAWSELGGGAYQIEVVDANGCTADALTFDIVEPTEFDVFLDATMSTNNGSGEIRLGDTVFLSATTTGDTAAVVQWTPAQYVACDTCANTFGIPPASLTYAVSLVSGNGCTADDFIQVIVRDERVVYFPTGFSPNGDNVNDFFFPQAPEGLVNKVNSFIILDRWGEVVYRLNNFDINVRSLGWDGRLDGEEMNPQVFVFVAEVEYFDGRTELFKGDFSLIK